MTFEGTDSAMHAVIYIISVFSIYRSKVGAHYRSTLFADLNLETTYRNNTYYTATNLTNLTKFKENW